MLDINLDHITTDHLSLPLLAEKNVEAAILRLDKIHPLIAGNKWFKLRYYLEEAKQQEKKTIVTFGGAWSNHLLAIAAACKKNDLACIGIVRGEEPVHPSFTLIQAKKLGMQLVFVSRAAYGKGEIPGDLDGSTHYLIPAGGYGIKGVLGAATIVEHYKQGSYSHICSAAGTGTMTAGLINGSSPAAQNIAISVLKNNDDLEKDIGMFVTDKKRSYQVIHDYHFGGYAKYNSTLLHFMNEFYKQSTIPSDFVYTGKLFFGIHDLISNNFFPAGSKILFIHSGGLQGNASLSKGTLIF